MMTSEKYEFSIIEFAGVPGSGKSTMSRDLIVELSASGFSVLDFAQYRRQIQMGKVKRNLNWLKIIVYNLKIILWLFKTLPSDFIYSLKHILDALCIVQELNNSKLNIYDVIVIDQGIIQAISAALDSNIYSNDSILESFIIKNYYNYRDVNIVSCLLDYDIALKRLKTRDKTNNEGKLDSIINEDLLFSLYNAIGTNLIKISDFLRIDKINIITLNTEKEISESVKTIIKSVKIEKKGEQNI